MSPWWEIGAAANAIVAVAYFAIAYVILSPLVRTGQVRENRLGTATALIFFTCAVHHGTHSIHMMGPVLGFDERAGLSLRDAFQWHNAVWDVFTAFVGIYYWSLRRTYGPLMRGAKLFEDMKDRQRRAMEINDDIVQGLTVAKLSLELGEQDRSEQAMNAALASASRIITELLGRAEADISLGAGSMHRDAAAEATKP